MRLFKKWPVRLSLFLAGFLALAGLADLILVPLGSREVLGAYDFIHADNADVVFIGDSLCIYQINPSRFEEITGKSALNYGIGSAKAKSHVTMAREVFRLKKPQKLVVVFDPEIDIVQCHRINLIGLGNILQFDHRFIIGSSRELRYFLTISATLKMMAWSNSRRSNPVSFLIFSRR